MPLRLCRRKGSQSWYIRGAVRGVRVFESAQTTLREEAEEIRARREAALWNREVRGERGSHTFGEACLIYLKAREPGPSSCAFLSRLLPHFEYLPLDKIDQNALDAYILRYHGKAKPATIKRAVIAPITVVLNVAAKRGWCDRPAFERPRIEQGEPRFLTRDEADRLIAAAAPHLKPVIIFLINTGARLGEALALDWSHVDLTAKRVRFVRTKSGRPRGVPLNDDVFLALVSLAHRKGRVFLTPAGTPYHDNAGAGGTPIKTAFHAAVRRAGIDHVRVHDLRHTFASWLVMEGIPIRTVAELLGHANIQMTMRYAHLTPDHAATAVQSISRHVDKINVTKSVQLIDKNI